MRRQMYKVFLNDNIIHLCPDDTAISGKTGKIIPFVSSTQIIGLTERIEKDEGNSEIIITLPDPESLLNHFKSAFTFITAAGGIVKNNKNQLLFIYRLGRWDLPKGKVKKNESSEAGAIREVEEECGISGVKLISRIGSTFHIYRSPFMKEPGNLVLKETHWHHMFYDGNENLKPQISEDIVRAEWMGKDDSGKVLANTYKSLQDLISDCFSAL